MKRNIRKSEQLGRFGLMNLYMILPVIEDWMPAWLITFYAINAVAFGITAFFAYCPFYEWSGLNENMD